MTGILHIVVARKPIEGTIAENCLKHGAGAVNIDGCRVEAQSGDIGNADASVSMHQGYDRPWMHDPIHLEAWLKRKQESNDKAQSLGRWPANLILDTSSEVQKKFPENMQSSARPLSQGKTYSKDGSPVYGKYKGAKHNSLHADSGSASRFFFNFSEQQATEPPQSPLIPKPSEMPPEASLPISPPTDTTHHPL